MKKAAEEDPDEVLDKMKAESKIVMASTINTIKAGEKFAANPKWEEISEDYRKELINVRR